MAGDMLSLGEPVKLKGTSKSKVGKPGLRHLYDEVLAIVQDNGQVTLPSAVSAQVLAKRRYRSALVLAGVAIFVLRMFAAKRHHRRS
jgi:hypothetical protein